MTSNRIGNTGEAASRDGVSARGLKPRRSAFARLGLALLCSLGVIAANVLVLLLPSNGTVAQAQGNQPEAAAAQQGLRTDSRAPYVHWINLYDEHGQIIDLRDRNAPPYSPTMTCGRCHNINAINHGWHFNANRSSAEAGRPGEPWIFTDPDTRTQLPLSYRGWDGTYHPEAMGLNEWQFTRRFGSHMPGGGPGMGPAPDRGDRPAADTADAPETETAPDPADHFADPMALEGRWHISGFLENDCMMCHDRSGSYDLNEWSRQIDRENFRWAPTAAMGLARVIGRTSDVPDDFDPEFPEFTPDAQMPELRYDASKLNMENRVFFDVVRQPLTERCYQCHTSHEVDLLSKPRWQRDHDVHMLAGMNCADCHRHGIDHAVIRGFEGEASLTGNQAAATLSCAGCHTGNAELAELGDVQALGGRLGAPIPEHKGIPPLHFEVLSCTACHSGPWPEDNAMAVQTSLAHGLGISREHRDNADPPHIVQPVFVRNEEGLIEPHRMVWPAFWGVLEEEDQSVTPLVLSDSVRRVLTRALAVEPTDDEESSESRDHHAGLKPVTSEQLAAALAAAQGSLTEGKCAVYIAGGKLHRLVDGEVVGQEHQAAEPYSWPLAHDVRSANQSLGVRSCQDCHAADSPFIAGLVAAQPISPTGEVVRRMHELQDVDPVLWETWAQGFVMRDAFKAIAFLAVGILALILLWLAMHGFTALHTRKKAVAAGTSKP